MQDIKAYWLNSDMPTLRAVLHVAGCLYVHAKHGTLYKRIEQLKRDGGWWRFATPEEAQSVVRHDLQPNGFVSVIPCADCLG